MPKQFKVNAREFRRQVEAEVIGPDSLAEIELDDDGKDTIKVRLGVTAYDDDDSKAFGKALDSVMETRDEDALFDLITEVVGQTCDAAREKVKKAGLTASDITLIWGEQTSAARDRLGNFRYTPLPR